MPLDSEARAFLKQVYGQLKDEALRPGDPRYQPIYEALGPDDPVQTMFTHIDFSDVESIQLFSGYRGSGKTTELYRLKQKLENDGYFVLYVDALEYVNPAEPIDVSDLLVVLAGAFSDAVEHDIGFPLGHESFWDKLTGFLTGMSVSVESAGASAEFTSPLKSLLGGLKAGANIKLQLKNTSSFRTNLQQVLAGRLGELKNKADKFFEDGVKLVRSQRGDKTRIVLIFDQLEQIRGSFQTEQQVTGSVERLFASHMDILKLPYIHAIYTVPPWLKFLLRLTERNAVLPAVHLWKNDAERSRCAKEWAAFHALISRRLEEHGIERLFGGDGDGPIGRVIDASGGQFRDLLRILREVILRASSLESLPVPESVVTSAVNAARSEFLPIATDDAKWLAEIALRRHTALPSTGSADIHRLTRFLDNHSVLYFINGSEWYDVHPLIRDELRQLLETDKETAE